MQARVIHLTWQEGLSPVFLSQVVRPMSRLRAQGLDISLAVFAPLGQLVRPGQHTRFRERVREVRRDFGLPLSVLPSPPQRWPLWRDAWVLRQWLRRKEASRDRPTILHGRGTQAAWLAARSSPPGGPWRVLYDCRGVDAEEILYVNGYRTPAEAPVNLRRRVEERLRRRAYAARESHAVLCVSNALSDFMAGTCGLAGEKLHVAPCAVDGAWWAGVTEGREATRERLGLSHAFVAVFCGSAEAWQCPREVMRLFSALHRQRRDARLLVVTPHARRMQEAARSESLAPDLLTVVTAPHHEVPRYLAAGDLGLLVREPCLVNRVACPVKFAEYLVSGLPVLISEDVGDLSRLVEERAVGAVLACPAPDAVASPLLAAYLARYDADVAGMRERCRAVAREHFDLSRTTSILEDVYRKLAGGDLPPSP